MENKLKMSIDIIDNYKNDEDVDYAVIRLKYLSSGENSHGINISEDVLKNCADTLVGKPIVAKYNKYKRDVEGHEPDEVMVGIVPHNAVVHYEDSENGVFAVVDGLISKLYASDVYEIYKKDNNRAVSIEMTADIDENDNVLSFILHGVTLLGKDINPSCYLASSEIIKFSENDANNFYDKEIKKSELKKFANERNNYFGGECMDKEKETLETVEQQTPTMAEESNDMEKDKMEENIPENKFEDDSKENDDEDDKGEDDVEMSYDAYADVAAIDSMLEKETEENQNLAKEMLASKDLVHIMSKFFEVLNEKNKYESDIKKFEKAQRETFISSVFSKIKEEYEIPEDKIVEFTEKAKPYKFENLNVWENEFKVFAYENCNKKNTMRAFEKFGGDFEDNDSEDIFAKYGAKKNTI